MSDAPGPITALPGFAGLPPAGSPEFDALVAFCDRHRNDALTALPWVGAQIADACGFAAMLRVIQRHGGRRVYLPRGLQACSARLGVELDAATHRHLLDRAGAAGTLEIPSGWGVFVALRRVAIRAAVRAGFDPNDIALAFGVTPRHLRRDVADARADADTDATPN